MIATVSAARYPARGIIDVDQPLQVARFAGLEQPLAGQLREEPTSLGRASPSVGQGSPMSSRAALPARRRRTMFVSSPSMMRRTPVAGRRSMTT